MSSSDSSSDDETVPSHADHKAAGNEAYRRKGACAACGDFDFDLPCVVVCVLHGNHQSMMRAPAGKERTDFERVGWKSLMEGLAFSRDVGASGLDLALKSHLRLPSIPPYSLLPTKFHTSTPRGGHAFSFFETQFNVRLPCCHRALHPGHRVCLVRTGGVRIRIGRGLLLPSPAGRQ